MDDQPLCQQVLITNPQGLHLRPAAAFARRALLHPGEVYVLREEMRVNGKSVLDLLTLVALPGTELTIEVSGEGAAAALEELAGLINSPVEDPDMQPPPASGI
jgi:phosphotransferase system HPr (HPr) family protein